MQCQEIEIADLTPLSKMNQVVQNILLIFYMQNSSLTKLFLRQSILGQQECRCGVEYQQSNSGGLDYIVGGAEVDIVSQNKFIKEWSANQERY